jgi:hypothetical protein
VADNEFSDAWMKWLSGASVAQDILWGHPIFIWARLGKIVSAGATLPLVAEIIGHTRVARCAERIRIWDPPAVVTRVFDKPRGWAKNFRNFMAKILGVAVVFAILIRVFGGHPDFVGFIGCYAVVAILFLIAFLIVEMMRFYASILAEIIDMIAWFLEHRRIKLTMRWFSLAVLLGGFFFDLLGS